MSLPAIIPRSTLVPNQSSGNDDKPSSLGSSINPLVSTRPSSRERPFSDDKSLGTNGSIPSIPAANLSRLTRASPGPSLLPDHPIRAFSVSPSSSSSSNLGLTRPSSENSANPLSENSNAAATFIPQVGSSVPIPDPNA
eukprot:CAMPEP_0175065988 /NCGR_PEP_ID=MMETSP0052_2-20121109/16250_1 /TAXON_ID=51329 ORGANISM="Polytomella parva, Strain SAG 63-3" /NCGR_SAMPLE_ID=MMETSP0052_2 /ASSEMBLY_ACC=CAM_ASM_000194 /LENGTH=138 /DNA_ID=CAMNT_0016332623 /DNA_START=39 /DNA_END=452 /DNA_ORIENTATION=+